MIDIDCAGLEETTDAFHRMDLGTGRNMRKMVRNVTEDIADGMRERVPTWRNELERSISTEYVTKANTHIGIAMASASHAAPVELGTGTKGPKGRRYFPNPENVHAWAIDEGFKSGYQFAAIVYHVLGGTEPVHYARETVEDVAGRSLGRRADEFIQELT